MKKHEFKDKKHIDEVRQVFLLDPYFAATGLFFGFPECCIEGFITDYNEKTKVHYPEAPFIGTGFVPCICCAESATHNWPEFKAKIEKNRISTLPFPEDNNDAQRYRFFYQLTDKLGYDPKLLREIDDDPIFLSVLDDEEKIANGKHTIRNAFVEKFKDVPKISAKDVVVFLEDNIEFDAKMQRNVIKPLEKMLKRVEQCIDYETAYNLAHSIATNEIKDALYVMMQDPQMSITEKKLHTLVNQVSKILYPTYEYAAINIKNKKTAKKRKM